MVTGDALCDTVIGVAVSGAVPEQEKTMLTAMQLRALKPGEKLYKVAD
jgi:hypothetical protein